MTGIGFIGLGDMGTPMARRLLACGHEVHVWNRTESKLAPLVESGAIPSASPAALVEATDLLCLCVTSHTAILNMLDGPDGLLPENAFARRRIIVDCSTGDPQVARSFAHAADLRNIGWIDAPVSGGVPAATSGELIMFLGGNIEDIAAAAPLLNSISKSATHVGPSGAGQTVKLCNQMIVATNIMAIAEMMEAARRNGVNVERLPDALKSGFADSLPLQLWGPRMARRQFSPRLGAIELMAKDVGLALTMVQNGGGSAPLLSRTKELYESNVLDGSSDIASLIHLFE